MLHTNAHEMILDSPGHSPKFYLVQITSRKRRERPRHLAHLDITSITMTRVFAHILHAIHVVNKIEYKALGSVH